jgi:hypothetical protein
MAVIQKNQFIHDKSFNIILISAVVFIAAPKLRDCAMPSQHCAGSLTSSAAKNGAAGCSSICKTTFEQYSGFFFRFFLLTIDEAMHKTIHEAEQ